MPIHKLHCRKSLKFYVTLFYFFFGHPEGFGLPVAEALVNCCAVVDILA